MKVLVTGGAGFIGSHLVSHLSAIGMDVVVVDKNRNKNNLKENISYYICDIRDKQLQDILQKERPEVIFHLAAQSSVSMSMTNPYEDATINIMGTINLIENAVPFGVKKIIFASSAAIYGVPQQLPISEDHPIQPTSYYGLSKAIGEEYISMYAKNNALDYTILRFSNVYGYGQTMDGEAGIITKLLQCVMEKQPFYIYGDGTQTRDFVYVKDVVHACVKAISPNQPKRINISSNSEISINSLIQLLKDLSHKPMSLHYVERKTGDIWHSRLQNKLALTSLAWHPLYNIEEGLQMTLESISKKV